MGSSFSAERGACPPQGSLDDSTVRHLRRQFAAWTADDAQRAVRGLRDQRPDRVYVGWTALYRALEEADAEREAAAEKRRRAAHHPAAHGFSLRPTEAAATLTDDIGQRGGGGGGQASETGADGGAAGERTQAAMPAAGADGSETRAPGEDALDAFDDLGEMDEEELALAEAAGELEGAGPAPDQPAPAAERSLAQEAYYSKTAHQRYMRQLLPEERRRSLRGVAERAAQLGMAWDPAATSPVFWGHYALPAATGDSEAAERRRAQWELLQQFRDRQAGRAGELEKERQRKLDDLKARSSAEQEARAQRRRDEAQRREEERAEAERTLPEAEYNIFLSHWQQQQRKIEDAEAAEDAERRREVQEEERVIRGEGGSGEGAGPGEVDAPLGHKVAEQARAALRGREEELAVKAAAVEKARVAADKASKGLAARARPSVAKAAHAKVEAAREEEREVKEAVARLREETALAEALELSEARFIPLYRALVDPGTQRVNLVEAALLIGLCTSSDLHEKIQFCFAAFDFNESRSLSLDEMVILVSALVRALERLGGLAESLTEQEVHSLAVQAFGDADADRNGLLSEFEFLRWAKGVVEQDAQLSSLFGAPWKYASFSAFQREGMAPVHKYRLGLLSLSQLQVEVRRGALRHRPMLQPEAKRALHLRALARGGDDPLKPNYGRFIQQQRRQAVGRAVALSHGSLVNALHQEARSAHNAALRIQTAWRGRMGRQAARTAQARIAFYAERRREIEAAAEEARESVMANESLAGFRRMKWDTHVRMVQAKLRSAGSTVDRRGVLKHLADEAIKEAVAPVMARYARLERERGYHPRSAPTDPARPSANAPASAPPPSAFHASEALQADDGGANAEGGAGSADQEGAAPTDDAPQEREPGEGAGKGPSAPPADAAPGGSAGLLEARDPFASFLDQGGSVAPRALKLLRQQMELRRDGRPPSHLRVDVEARRRALRAGDTPDHLFHLPPTTAELAEAEGVHDAWADVREVLAVAAHRVTSKHAGAFVPESAQQAIAAWLPSKRLLLRLVHAFMGRPIAEFGDFLRAEFAVPGRVAQPLAAELQALEAEDDLGGRVRQLSSGTSGRGTESALLERAVAAAADSTIESVLSTAAMARGGGGGGGGSDGGEKATASRRPGAGTLQRRALERSALATRLERRRAGAVRELAEARAQYEQVLGQVARAEETVRSSDQQLRVLRAAHGDEEAARLLRSVGGRHRCDWMARWWGAVEAPERSFDDAVAKYSELGAVVADFQACATRVAVTLVREQHMPHFLRSLKPVRSTDPFLLRGERAERVIVHNLRARIADDETGLFAGSAELARKAAASAFRNATLWLLCRGCRRAAHPLTTVVDVFGQRVLVTAELPLVSASEEVEGAATWAPRPLSAVAGPGLAWKRAGLAPQVVDPLADPGDGEGEHGAVVDEGAVLSEAEKLKRQAQLERRAMALIEPARTSVPLSPNTGDDAGRLVHGTEDYGGTIVAGVDDEAEACLQRFASVYGLARHAVMSQGARIPVQVPTAATVNARRGVDGRLYIHRLARAMPPEHPEEVGHLPAVPSGLSIFARFLRPEFLRRHAPQALSSDALSMLAHRAPGGQEHEEALRAATRALVRERIPAFADAVATWTPERLEAADWSHELHGAGINWRHVGLVRHRFWHQLAGTARVAFGDRSIRTSVPMERQLAPSQAFLVELAGEELEVEATALPQDAAPGAAAGGLAHLIPDPRFVTGPWASELSPSRWGLVLCAPPARHSSAALPLWAGATRCPRAQATTVRRVLLREILLRAAAAVGREVLRESLRRVEYGGDAELAGAGAGLLNLVTMADAEGVRFWQRDVRRALLSKFGRVSVSAREGVDLAATALPHLAWLVPRIAAKLGLSVAGPALNALRLAGEAPAPAACALGFDFSASDMSPPGVARIRGWQHVTHSAQGRILYLRARRAVRTRYAKRVAGVQPLLYLPLHSGPRTRIARNEGTAGKAGDADVHNGVEFTWDGGPLAWAPTQKGGFARFHASQRHHLQVGLVPQLASEDDSQPLAVEAWVRVVRSAGATQVVLQSGRVALYRLCGDTIACALYSVLHSVEVVLRGPTLALDAWHHVCAAFDGVALRLFLDGALVAELGNVHALAQELAQRALEQRVDRYERAKADVEARRKEARAAALDDGEQFAATAEGLRDVEVRMRKLASNPGRAKDALRSLEQWEEGMAEHWTEALARRQQAKAARSPDRGNAAALFGKGHGIAQRAAAAAAGAWESGQRQARKLRDSDEIGSEGEAEGEVVVQPKAEAKEGPVFSDLRVEAEGGESPPPAGIAAAGERVRARLEAESPASSLQPFSDAELRDMAIRGLVRDRLREREAALDEEWGRVKERFLRAQQAALERVQLPLRIGAAAGRSSRGATQCFDGDLAHVAVHSAALQQRDVLRRLAHARENPRRTGIRHYEASLARLRRAIRLQPDDVRALKFFADAVCADIGLGPDPLTWRGRYVQRVRTALREFVRAGSVDGALALALALPKDDPANSNLVCEVLDAVEGMESGVFGRHGGRSEEAVSLAGTVFGLGMAVSREATHRRWAAAVLRAGLRKDGRACGTVHDVGWLTQLRSDRVLCRLLAHAAALPLLDDSSVSGTPFVDVAPDEWRQEAGSQKAEAAEPEDDGRAPWGAAHAHMEETEELVGTAGALSTDGTLVRLHLDGCAEVGPEDLDLLSDRGREVAVLTLSRMSGPRLSPSALALVCSRMRHLRVFDVSHTHSLSSEALEQVVSQCSELEVLRVRGCQQLEDASLVAVAAACPTLRELDAHDVRTLTDATLVAFGRHCKFLRRIDVGWSVLVTDEGLSAFAAEANAEALVSLGLAHCRRITDTGAKAVAEGLGSLTRLDLSYCTRVTTAGAARLTHGLVHLRGLRLRGLPEVQDAAFQHSAAVDDRAVVLQNMLRSVEVLDLRDCTALTSDMLRALGERAMKHLRMLSLFGCEGLVGRGLDACFQGGRQGAGASIKSLDLSYSGVDDQTVADVAAHAPSVEVLRLRGATSLSQSAMQEALTSLSRLTEIDLAHARHAVTDESLRALGGAADRMWLERVDISYCKRVTDVGVDALTAAYGGIRSLAVRWCTRLTDRTVQCAAARLDQLALLDVRDCPAISTRVLARLRGVRPSAQVFASGAAADPRGGEGPTAGEGERGVLPSGEDEDEGDSGMEGWPSANVEPMVIHPLLDPGSGGGAPEDDGRATGKGGGLEDDTQDGDALLRELGMLAM